MVNVDEVETARFDLDARFAGLRLRNRNVLVGQNFRTAVIVNSNGFHLCSSFLFGRGIPVESFDPFQYSNRSLINA
jgi:hypothetical protein